MQFTNGNTTNYVYDASGQKLSVTHLTAVAGVVIPMTNVMTPLAPAQISSTFKTDYCGNVIYENGAVSKILTDEGYITFTGATPVYHYYLKDHQGNNRVVINQAGTVEQVTHYYPFGGLMGESTSGGVQPYKYNGKELDRVHGLDLFDYGKRHYDAVLGRWHSVDPMADQAPGWTPYRAFFNNPIRYIDPDGLFEDDYYINSDGTIEVTKTDDNFDRFYLKTTGFDGEGEHTTLVGQFDKNENGLIQLPSQFSFTNRDFGTSFSFSVKEGNESRSFIRGDAFAAFIGAMSTTNTQDLTIIGFSNSDGSSSAPSVSHKQGINGDLRYLRTDNSGGPVLLNQSAFDIERQNTFNNALHKFGWTDMLSERFTPAGQTGSMLLNHTRHYSKSRHHNHLHLQGFKPNLITR